MTRNRIIWNTIICKPFHKALSHILLHWMRATCLGAQVTTPSRRASSGASQRGGKGPGVEQEEKTTNLQWATKSQGNLGTPQDTRRQGNLGTPRDTRRQGNPGTQWAIRKQWNLGTHLFWVPSMEIWELICAGQFFVNLTPARVIGLLLIMAFIAVIITKVIHNVLDPTSTLVWLR